MTDLEGVSEGMGGGALRPSGFVPTEGHVAAVVSGHTPGPWLVHDTGLQFVLGSAEGLRVGRFTWHAYSRQRFPLKAEAEANARLSARAPEMLEMLIAVEGAMCWANSHMEGGAKYENQQQLERCMDQFEATLGEVSGLLKRAGVRPATPAVETGSPGTPEGVNTND